MVTRKLLALAVLLPLVTAGCGGGDEAEAKQAALAPANPAPTPAPDPAVAPAAVDSATVAAVPDSATMAAAAVDSADAGPEPLGRESFSYTGGSRDPFVSLLANTKIGPELPDLVLVAIYYDTRNPSGSVVVMREKVNNKKYNLRPGDRLGRMRVGSVRPKDVTFVIDDFGTERQETVSLRKQEDE